MTNPAFEVVVAIVVMLIAAWIVIDTDALHNGKALPAIFGRY